MCMRMLLKIKIKSIIFVQTKGFAYNTYYGLQSVKSAGEYMHIKMTFSSWGQNERLRVIQLSIEIIIGDRGKATLCSFYYVEDRLKVTSFNMECCCGLKKSKHYSKLQ